MNSAKRTSLIAAALFLAGCVVSLNPLYTPKDLVYDPALIGAWVDNGKNAATWTFEKADESSYKLVVADGDNTSPFVARLVQLGSRRFLDICPDRSALNGLKLDDLYKTALIRGHLFLKVVRIEPTLQLGLLNDDWLGKLLKSDPGALAHQVLKGDDPVGDTLLLTATTEELQKFVISHWDTKSAWGDKTSDLTRK